MADQQDSLRIHLSLVSHTNIGKTTLARTLLMRDVGEIADRAHVTETTDDYLLARGQDGSELILWDTPGFGNSVALAKRLEGRSNPLGWFLSEVWDRFTNKSFWLDQKAVRHIRDISSVVLYLVNIAETPDKTPYIQAEMQILSWIGKPVIVLLNQMGKPQAPDIEHAQVEAWKTALKPWPFVKKVLSLTGREIHPVAIEIGALTESEIVNGFASIPPDEELLCVVINCAGSLRCGLYPQKGIPTINVLPTWRAGPLAQFITEENYVSGVTPEQLVLVDTAEAPDSEPETKPEPAPRVISTPPPARGAEKLVRLVEQTGTAVGHIIALLFAASREAVDVSLRNVIPFMAFVSLLIALVQETALGSLIAHALTPLANSLWGLVLLSLICGIPFLSPVLGPGAAISQVIGVMIGTQIGAGAISPAFALPALFAINVQVGCDFVPVGLSMQEAKPETIAKGVPAFLLSRQLTGPLAVIIGWLFSLGLF